MTPEDVLNYYGSTYRFAVETGMSHSTLNNWLSWGYVPADAQLRVERLTGGGLKALDSIKEQSVSITEKTMSRLQSSIQKLDEHIDKLQSKKRVLQAKMTERDKQK